MYTICSRIIASLSAYLHSIEENLISGEEIFSILFPSVTLKRNYSLITPESSVEPLSLTANTKTQSTANEADRCDAGDIEWEDGAVEVRIDL